MVNAKNIIIGTRKSALAKAQSFAVKNYICNSSDSYKKNPDLISIKGFQTSGDSILDKNLSDIGGKAC